jgi:hypothetical protein
VEIFLTQEVMMPSLLGEWWGEAPELLDGFRGGTNVCLIEVTYDVKSAEPVPALTNIEHMIPP